MMTLKIVFAVGSAFFIIFLLLAVIYESFITQRLPTDNQTTLEEVGVKSAFGYKNQINDSRMIGDVNVTIFYDNTTILDESSSISKYSDTHKDSKNNENGKIK